VPTRHHRIAIALSILLVGCVGPQSAPLAPATDGAPADQEPAVADASAAVDGAPPIPDAASPLADATPSLPDAPVDRAGAGPDTAPPLDGPGTPAGDPTARNLTNPDGVAGAYPVLQRSYALEVPDCGHMVPHVVEAMDAQLGRPVFAFLTHRDLDSDACMYFDRQRTEVRGNVPEVQSSAGATVFYRWKFKLPAGFLGSTSFTHIFQLKSYGNGFGTGAPIMTLSVRNGNISTDGRIGVFGNTSLVPFLDAWVAADLKVVQSHSGRFELTIRRVDTGATLLSEASNADMVDEGSLYNAPKFGIYRSLLDKAKLRDEEVRFADLCVSHGKPEDCDAH
jgi:hypothetical protein